MKIVAILASVGEADTESASPGVQTLRLASLRCASPRLASPFHMHAHTPRRMSVDHLYLLSQSEWDSYLIGGDVVVGSAGIRATVNQFVTSLCVHTSSSRWLCATLHLGWMYNLPFAPLLTAQVTMASHNSFDNQAPALLDRHPQSPSSPPPAVSSPNLLNSTSSPLLFTQPVLLPNLRRSADDHQTPPPVPPHQNTAVPNTTAVTTTTVAVALQSPHPTINSSCCILIDGQPQSVEAVQNLVAHLREEIALRNTQIARLTGEVESLRRIVGDRNRDVDQLKSVLDQKYIPLVAVNGANRSSSSRSNNNAANTLASVCAVEETMELGESGVAPLPVMPSPQSTTVLPARTKKQGVCGESVSRNANIGFIHYEKDHK